MIVKRLQEVQQGGLPLFENSGLGGGHKFTHPQGQVWNRKYFLRVRKYDIAAGIRIQQRKYFNFFTLRTERKVCNLIFRLLHQNRFLSNSTCRHHTRTVTKPQSFVKCARPYNQWIKGMMGKKRSWGLLNLSYFLPSHPFSSCLLHPAGYEEDYGKVSNNPASIWPNSLLSFLQLNGKAPAAQSVCCGIR